MKRTLSSQVPKSIGKEVLVEGWIHKIRKLGGINFLVIRDRSGLVQAIVGGEEAIEKLKDLTTETVVKIIGNVVKEDRAPGGAEIHVTTVEVLSPVKEDLPVEINKKDLNVNLDTLFDWRPITLRAPKQRAIFKVQAEILSAWRDFFKENDFTEINTPKIVEAGAETGGAEMFEIKYFKKKAFLAQSPQLYKEIMAGVFERVFETAYAYRAEPHSTSRHINEYLSLDMEMGFIDSWMDLINIHQELIKFILESLKKNAKAEFELLGATLPEYVKIPVIKLREAQEILEKEYGEKCVGEPDLEPRHEKQICEYSNKKWGTEFIFITHYPSKKRPFYTMDDPESPEETLSFDLLFRGLEVTTGSQRIHRYEDHLEKMRKRGMSTKGFEDYLNVFKYGMPPHGGFCQGLERLTARFLELDNVKEASLFPRDMNRLRP
ncbi:TPA: aspartate--tRNA(Asn) ligase [candidate division CPR2 bacterium]|uniref:Aspartate--tRNA(Asp/Asn) ligase n=1 Tax=candidate division CPR2 bacterium GW2011_GWC1_41_48 TaxID=1618344 RepID=A0A0G0W9Z8_UNCC2|nr:MAG: Aspartyl-tRNA synthetase, archaeal type [candidate division CPR2 bacterium GW2011_GWC2_39_35]KKR28003.1 MAG: Aspartyl-tRNA synthetase, archaeal type [candidate division CPR2 bacterium GW2011_GWD2_39_7]KKS09834.1 MAG: Aspartate-tRNA(Asn) ligase [candidate division CPR2 bacterium GW2011_GWC1_41_48]OGB72098.1 MAG: aspartate--tRNA(Asn) ligase [candidate division CPR2 bacterium GWD2_39_7]HBG81627.1 aspartate--tRNA(Asn) ligase [candidate division CPR2 bacterium]